jgi:hypothetical protein
MDKLIKEIDKMIREELKDFRACEDRDYKVGRLSGMEAVRELAEDLKDVR